MCGRKPHPKKVADSKISGYMWTGPKPLYNGHFFLSPRWPLSRASTVKQTWSLTFEKITLITSPLIKIVDAQTLS